MKIHPTAIVEDGAQLADDVEVGPYSLIGPEVVVGAGCQIQAHVVLTSRVTLGEGNFIGHGSILGAAPQDLSHTDAIVSEVRIGNHNKLREYVTIHRGAKEGGVTRLGDHNYLMNGCHLGHDCQVGNRIIIANDCLLAGHVLVEDRAVLGGGAVFHQFLRLGTLAMISGGTRFNKDIPPYTLADDYNNLTGLNVIGLRRAGFNPELRAEIRRAYKLVYREGLNVSQALAEAAQTEWSPEARHFFDFIRHSKRGICHADSSSVKEKNNE